MGRKIRDAEVQKTPYMLIVGAKEAEADSVGVRRRSEGDRGAVPTAAFVEQIKAEIDEALGR